MTTPPTTARPLTTAQRDRAAGTVLAGACGDALGAPLEFGGPYPATQPLAMTGGGGFGWAPGEWTDDTSMAVPILRAAAAGKDLLDEATQDEIVAVWSAWARTAKDVGNQTRAVLTRAVTTAAAARASAERHHLARGRSAGNGSLMRTGPVALAYLGPNDAPRLAEAARSLSDLTHHEADAGDACVLWSLALRHAIRTGELDIRAGLESLPAERRARWTTLIDEAEREQPSAFTNNFWVVQAFQGAWSAISQTRAAGPADGSHLVRGIEAAVRGGYDTDTVAAIAGSLLGARYGASAVPATWRRVVHGWPGLRGDELAHLALLATTRGASDPAGWPAGDRMAYHGYDISALVRHPHDPQVWLGAVGALDTLPDDVDAVVSLCRVGTAQIPERIEHGNRVLVRLMDRAGAEENINLDLVLLDAADAVAALRAEGRTVLLHCVQAHSRTPSVGALYAARHLGIPAERALTEVCAALPDAHPQRFLRDAVTRLGAQRG